MKAYITLVSGADVSQVEMDIISVETAPYVVDQPANTKIIGRIVPKGDAGNLREKLQSAVDRFIDSL